MSKIWTAVGVRNGMSIISRRPSSRFFEVKCACGFKKRTKTPRTIANAHVCVFNPAENAT